VTDLRFSRSDDFIPCMANLCHGHIERLAACATCGADEESTFHALVECTFARGFWAILKERMGIKLPTLCPRTWTEDILNDSFCSDLTVAS
jgi:hypothetical protein